MRRRGPIRLLAIAGAVGATIHIACSDFGEGATDDPVAGPDAAADSSPAIDAATDAATDACAADTSVDPSNCGACGRSCAGRACSGGRCATANAYAGVACTGFSLADAGIYVATIGPPSFVALVGYDLLPVANKVVAGGVLAFSVAADDAVYWTDLGGVVRSVPLDMVGPATVIGATDASAATLTKRPQSAVYWTVRASGANGGGLYSGFFPSSGALVEPADEAFGIADDDTYVYYSRRVQGGTIIRRQKAGPESIPIGTASGIPVQLAADDFHVYFTDCAAGSVVRVAKDGSGQVDLASNLPHAYGIALDRDYVYVSVLGANLVNCVDDGQLGTADVASVVRISKATGERLVLADQQTAPLFLATRADPPLLYWTSASGAKMGIWNVPK